MGRKIMGSEIVSLGEFIAKRRKQMRMTQEKMAEKMHVSKSAIAKWETDGGIPDRENLKSLSKVINISVDDLHRIIDSNEMDEIDLEVNITGEVIAMLESYGYIVIKPKKKEKSDKESEDDE